MPQLTRAVRQLTNATWLTNAIWPLSIHAKAIRRGIARLGIIAA